MNFSPMNPTASLGIQIIMIILQADTYVYLDQMLSTKSTELILLLYHTSLQAIIQQSIKLQCGKFSCFLIKKYFLQSSFLHFKCMKCSNEQINLSKLSRQYRRPEESKCHNGALFHNYLAIQCIHHSAHRNMPK